jgi:hypothetical protein
MIEPNLLLNEDERENFLFSLAMATGVLVAKGDEMSLRAAERIHEFLPRLTLLLKHGPRCNGSVEDSRCVLPMGHICRCITERVMETARATVAAGLVVDEPRRERANCPGCGFEFEQTRHGLLVDRSHGYMVTVIEPGGERRLRMGHPVHSCPGLRAMKEDGDVGSGSSDPTGAGV